MTGIEGAEELASAFAAAAEKVYPEISSLYGAHIIRQLCSGQAKSFFNVVEIYARAAEQNGWASTIVRQIPEEIIGSATAEDRCNLREHAPRLHSIIFG
jgi:hypothetical protein